MNFRYVLQFVKRLYCFHSLQYCPYHTCKTVCSTFMPEIKHHSRISRITLTQLLFTVIVSVAVILLKHIKFKLNFYHIFICLIIHIFHLKKMPLFYIYIYIYN